MVKLPASRSQYAREDDAVPVPMPTRYGSAAIAQIEAKRSGGHRAPASRWPSLEVSAVVRRGRCRRAAARRRVGHRGPATGTWSAASSYFDVGGVAGEQSCRADLVRASAEYGSRHRSGTSPAIRWTPAPWRRDLSRAARRARARYDLGLITGQGVEAERCRRSTAVLACSSRELEGRVEQTRPRVATVNVPRAARPGDDDGSAVAIARAAED